MFPAVATKGVAYAPPNQSAADPRARDNALAAIGKARLWLEEILAGGTFAEIAKREGKGGRQIRLLLPLAFVPPATVRGSSMAQPQLPVSRRWRRMCRWCGHDMH